MTTKGEVSSELQLLGEARKGFAWSLATHLEDIQDENNPVGEVLTAVNLKNLTYPTFTYIARFVLLDFEDPFLTLRHILLAHTRINFGWDSKFCKISCKLPTNLTT